MSNDPQTLADRLLALHHEQCTLQDSYGRDPFGNAARLAHGHASAAMAYKLAAMMVAGEDRVAQLGELRQQAIEEQLAAEAELKRLRQEVSILRARVQVDAIDIVSTGINLGAIRAWLREQGWARDGGIHTTGGAPWEEWRSAAHIELARARGRRVDRPRLCLYVAPTDRDLAELVQDIAKLFNRVGLDLVDEIKALLGSE